MAAAASLAHAVRISQAPVNQERESAWVAELPDRPDNSLVELVNDIILDAEG